MEKIKRIKITPNWHLNDSKWVLNKNIDGQYRSFVVAQGYTQIPGVQFTNNLSPVVTDATLHANIILLLNNKCSYQTIDVYTYFFCVYTEKEICMNIPEVMADLLE